MKWIVKVSSARCPYSDGYGGCTHPKMMEKQGRCDAKCRKKDCPIRIKPKKKKVIE